MVTLVPMNAQEYEQFLARSVQDYADEKVKAGAWKSEEAWQKSQAAFEQLLPDGIHTKGALLYAISDQEHAVSAGSLWLHVTEMPLGKSIFIYDIFVFEPFQGQGYGRQTMQAIDEKAKELGAEKVSLHVFAHNKRAFSLYQKSGYQVTDYSMSKIIE